MFKSKFQTCLTLLGKIAMTASLASACAQASYQVLEPSTSTGTTQGVTNPAPVSPAPSPVVTPPLAPTARVVVIYNNQSVTTVNANTATTVQPSWDTLSPSFITSSTCPNPGIIKAAYVITSASGPVPLSASRPAGSCQTLGLPYTFTTPGNYPISMTVTDQNNLTATASMTLTVLNGTTQDGGFTITALPILTQPNQPIAFTAYCFMPPGFTVAWNFADGNTAVGITESHPYAQVGQYTVNATCTSANGTTVKTASVTVVITTQAIVLRRNRTIRLLARRRHRCKVRHKRQCKAPRKLRSRVQPKHRSRYPNR